FSKKHDSQANTVATYTTLHRHHPTILWAQRKDVVYLTIEIADAPEAVITDKAIDFECVKEGKKYAFHMEFFDEIIPKESKKSDTKRVSFYILKKKEAGWWVRLCKPKERNNFIKTDFSRFADEDDSEDEDKPAHPGMDFSQLGMGGMPGMGGMGGMPGMGGMGGMGGMPDFSSMGGMPGFGAMGGDADHEGESGDEEDDAN
ncbi:Prostaglandin E synthase 3 (Cytosolic), partial [Coemansia furcata]